jgi:hypothetical protein
MKATQLLRDLGQGLWLENITRDLLDTGAWRGPSERHKGTIWNEKEK